MIKVLEIRDTKSLRAFNAFQALMLGMKMLPMYMGEHWEEFYSRLQRMPREDQIKVVREGAMIVPLDEDEVRAMILFCADGNGVPFTKENIKNLNPIQLIECIVAVSMEMLAFKVDFVSEDEKKN